MSSQVPQTALRNRLKSVLSEQLEGDEYLLWTSMPLPRQAATQKIYIALAGVLCCVAALHAWFFDKIFHPLGLVYGQIGWLAVLVLGILWLAAPLRAGWKAGRTMYAISNRRAFVIVLGRKIFIQAFKTFRLGHVETLLNRSGCGDLMFGRALQYAPGGPRYEREVGFYGLEDVHEAVAALKASHEKPTHSAGIKAEDS